MTIEACNQAFSYAGASVNEVPYAFSFSTVVSTNNDARKLCCTCLLHIKLWMRMKHLTDDNLSKCLVWDPSLLPHNLVDALSAETSTFITIYRKALVSKATMNDFLFQ